MPPEPERLRLLGPFFEEQKLRVQGWAISTLMPFGANQIPLRISLTGYYQYNPISLGIIQAARAEEVMILCCPGQAENPCVPAGAIRRDML